MKRWMLLACIGCVVSQAVANLPFGFDKRPPTQSMLQAASDPSPAAAVAATPAEEHESAPAPEASHDLASLVTVDDPVVKPAAPKKTVPAVTHPAPKAVVQATKPARWESVKPQGTHQDDTFVVTDPEPALLAGQVSALEQAQTTLTSELKEQKENQSDQVSQLTVEVMQLKKALLVLNGVIKSIAKQQSLMQAPKPTPSLLSKHWGGLSWLSWFLIALGALAVLLLICFWLFVNQMKAGSVSRQAVFLCIAESHVLTGDIDSAKRVLKQVLSRGSEEEKAKAATIMSKLM